MDSFLVTGGAGFIGSHIAEALAAKGAAVTVLDNLSTGRLRNMEPFKSKITFIEGDVGTSRPSRMRSGARGRSSTKRPSPRSSSHSRTPPRPCP